MRKSSFRSGLFVLSLALVVSACAANEPAAAPQAPAAPVPVEKEAAAFDGIVKLGVIEPLTGPASYYGERILQGVQLATKRINAAGGVLGKEIVLVVEDDQTDADQTVALFRRIAADNEVLAVIGPTHSRSFLAAAPLAEELQIVFASAGSGAPWPEGLPNQWNFRNTVPFTVMVVSQLETVLLGSGAQRVGSIYSDDNPGVAAPQSIGAAWIAATDGVEMVTEQVAATGTTDYGPQITQLIAADLDAVIVNLITEDGALFMSQARSRGLTAPFVSGNNGLLDLRIVELSGGAAEGLIVPSHFDPNRESAETKGFLEAWAAEFGVLDDFLVTYGHDLVYIMVEAMNKANTTTDRDAFRQAWGAISSLCLANGCYSYDGPGDQTKSDVFPIILTKDGYLRWTP